MSGRLSFLRKFCVLLDCLGARPNRAFDSRHLLQLVHLRHVHFAETTLVVEILALLHELLLLLV